MPEEVYLDYNEAEKAADMLVGDNPGMVAGVIETWMDLGCYEDGEEGVELLLVWADNPDEYQGLLDGLYLAYEAFEEQYHAGPVA